MNYDNYPILSRVFTRSVLKSFTTGRDFNDVYNLAVKLFISEPKKNTNRDNFELLYRILKNDYRNEYYYKNTLLNKLLLGVHSINTTTALTELPIAGSKADFMLINGKAVVYEIKTELDNLARLDSQIQNYYKAFNHVCVLTFESNADALFKKYKDNTVGIYVITPKETIRRIKEPLENNDDLSVESMFYILRKYEYENILFKYFGYLPKTSQFKYFEACMNLFHDIGTKNLNEMILCELKNRNHVTSDKFNNIPKSLKALSYFSELTPAQYDRLDSNLKLYY
ncbi:sce7726 family protein [Acetobacterium bakii]|uniref:Sce7726 family protein n=1 Tax=Acetobacterium bakii TaxID=52689 RepID=A0A0L6U557_9FIRM|nr:sce7726 family protein [Acetobacterium bakii]KNZ43457.1 hypothetical protein AKG39_00690 [Acetobacterium bakii]